MSGKEEEPQPIAMINPEILTLGDQLRMHEEGCLSIPDTHVEIERPSTVRVRFLDQHGLAQELEAEGLLATAIQHEIDHLDGRLIIDFLSKLRRDMVIRKFKKAAEAGQAGRMSLRIVFMGSPVFSVPRWRRSSPPATTSLPSTASRRGPPVAGRRSAAARAHAGAESSAFRCSRRRACVARRRPRR